MKFTPTPLLSVAAAATLLLAPAAHSAAPSVGAARIAIPVTCGNTSETVLAWDNATYDVRGTCGLVRVSADNATITMPTATRLIVEGTGNTITAKPIFDLEVSGADNTVLTPSLTSLTLSGASSSVQVAGLIEKAAVSAGGSSLSAHTAHRTRITGSSNTVAFTRAERLVVTGDHNDVTIPQGRTTVRDRGQGNALDLRRRRR